MKLNCWRWPVVFVLLGLGAICEEVAWLFRSDIGKDILGFVCLCLMIYLLLWWL